jgi:diguanylate cyclase
LNGGIVKKSKQKNRISDSDLKRNPLFRNFNKTILSLASVSLAIGAIFLFFDEGEAAADCLIVAVSLLFARYAALSGKLFSESYSSEDISYLKSKDIDVTERLFQDQATGLVNVFGLERKFNEECLRAAAKKEDIALMRVSINSINKSIYLQNLIVKDKLMMEVAKVLKGVVRTSDVVSRIGYNDFLVMVTGLTLDDDDEIIYNISKKIIFKTNSSIEVDGFEIHLDCNVGGAIISMASDPFNEALRKAELALSYAKRKGDNTSSFHSEYMDKEVRDEISAIERIRDGINRKEFVVKYQPRIDLKSGCVVGCEALVRWNSKSDDVVLPEGFMALAESSGLVGQIDRLVMDEACKQVNEWKNLPGLEKMMVGVNLSYMDLRREDFESSMIGILEKYEVSPKQIQIDVSAYSLTRGFERMVDALARMSAIGHKIHLDDSGDGYTSLAHVAALKLNCLNISQIFVKDLCTNAQSEEIVRSLIQLGKLKNIKVMAKGVEDRETLKKLIEMGCDYGQGWFWSKALSANDYIEFLKSKEKNT